MDTMTNPPGSYFAGGDGHLDLSDRLSHLYFSRTGIRAIENCPAFPDAERITEDFQAILESIIASIKDEAVCLNDRRGSDIAIIGPKARTRRGAGRTQNTFSGVVETRSIFG